MKKTLLCLAAVSTLAIAAPAAAQSWTNINQRQANLDQRIDVGVRNGSLTVTEAARLRAEFRDLASLEARYRATAGLNMTERADLDRRFNALSMRIRSERVDRDDRRDRADRYDRRDRRDDARRWYDDRGQWMNINQRQARLERRIEQGIRSGQITRAEAVRLRVEFNALARLERTYRRGGLTNRERVDLDRRFDILANRVHDERRDRERQYGSRW